MFKETLDDNETNWSFRHAESENFALCAVVIKIEDSYINLMKVEELIDPILQKRHRLYNLLQIMYAYKTCSASDLTL